MIDRRLRGFFVGVAALFFAHTFILAQEAYAAVYCQTDEQCPNGTTCIDDRCRLESDARAAPTDPGADQECSADRRCRIRRLARRNRARRQMQTLREEQALESLIERTQRQRDEEINRHDKPWTLDLATSIAHEAGLMGGYAMTPHIKAELSVYWPAQSIYASVGDQSVDGLHDYTLISLGPSYYFSESTVSPFVRGTLIYGTGEFHSYGYNTDRTLLQTETHAVGLGGGFDIQFDLGFHMRLGAMYRMLVFNEASIETGVYDDVARKALEDEFYPFDLVFLIGWAF